MPDVDLRCLTPTVGVAFQNDLHVGHETLLDKVFADRYKRQYANRLESDYVLRDLA
jgi:hypothetical protein